MRNLSRPLAAIALILGATCVEAQQVSAPQAATMEANLKEGLDLIGRAAPLDRAAAGVSGSAFQFSSEQGDTEASLAIKFNLDRYEPQATGKSDIYRLSALNLVLTATAPVSADQNGFGLFAGDNIVTGSRLKLAITRTSSLQKTLRDVAPYLLRVRLACVEAELAHFGDGDAQKKAKADAYRQDLSSRTLEPKSIDNILRLRMGDHGEVADYVKSRCADADFETQVKAYMPELRSEIESRAFIDKPMQFMGFDGSIGRDNYKILNRADFKVSDAAKNSWEVAAYFGLIDSQLAWSLRGRILYGQKYVATDEVELCRTVTGSTDQECIKGPDGTPIRKRSGLASVEGRYQIPLIDDQRIALAPQITYNFEDKDVGVEVPIYLSPDKDGKLSGGLKLAYTSKKDDFGVGLFVGVPFSIFYR